MPDIERVIPVIFCQAIDFFDRLDELYIGQVLIVTRYSKEKHDLINEAWIRDGNTSYRKLHEFDSNSVSNMNGDEDNVVVRRE